MKGRRRARRLALECLYELDQSTHPLDLVVRHRALAVLEDVLGTLGDRVPKALVTALAQPAARASLIEAAGDESAAGDPPDGWSDTLSDAAAGALASATGASVETVAEAHAKLVGFRQQVVYGARIVYGVGRALGRIDGVIAQIAPEWPVPQMAPIDRNVLRIALWELGTGSAPLRVVINEAVELAREYVGESSRRMVNGALGTYAAGAHALHLDPGS